MRAGMTSSGLFAAGSGRRTPDFAVRRGPRRSRRAVLARSGAGLVTLLLLGGAIWWALHSTRFAIAQVASGQYRFTSEEDLQAVFGGFLGRNIWTLSTAAVADSVTALPWVRDAHVVRRLPDRLEVEFSEWAPLLLLAPQAVDGVMRDDLVLLADGRVVPFPDHFVPPALPVLVEVSPVCGEDEPALRLPPEHASRVSALVDAIEEAGLEGAAPVDFVVARAEGYGIVLQDGQGQLLVGREEFEPRLQRWMTARDHLEPGLEYDLRFADRITVRPWR